MRLLMWLLVLFALFVLAGLIGRCDMRHAQPRSACRASPLWCIDFDNVEPAHYVRQAVLVHDHWPVTDVLSTKEAAS